MVLLFSAWGGGGAAIGIHWHHCQPSASQERCRPDSALTGQLEPPSGSCGFSAWEVEFCMDALMRLICWCCVRRSKKLIFLSGLSTG